MIKPFDKCLKEARTRAKLSQRVLAERVGIADSYISRMETGAFPPPSRDVTVKLADALGMSGRPVTLYLSKKDIATLERFVFFLAAYVAGSEDVENIRQLEDVSTYSTGHPSISVRSLPSGTIGGQIERLIAAADLSEEEEEEVGAALIEITKWRLAFMETQRKMRKESSS
jgi:transcriptional regulator with XRE-family HTH domain